MKSLIMSKSFYETLVVILIAVALFVGLRLTIQTYIVYGPSMEPNYWENEWIIVNKMAFKSSEPNTGDIIVFQPPIPSTKPFTPDKTVPASWVKIILSPFLNDSIK